MGKILKKLKLHWNERERLIAAAGACGILLAGAALALLAGVALLARSFRLLLGEALQHLLAHNARGTQNCDGLVAHRVLLSAMAVRPQSLRYCWLMTSASPNLS